MHQKVKMLSIVSISILALQLSGCATTSTSSSPAAAPKASASKPAVTFKAGTYTAEAEGKFAPVKLEVTLDSAKILKINVLDHNESQGVGDEAFKKISTKIIDGQTLAVDTVSGATLSSNAMLEAVEKCIVQAGGDPKLLKK